MNSYLIFSSKRCQKAGNLCNNKFKTGNFNVIVIKNDIIILAFFEIIWLKKPVFTKNFFWVLVIGFLNLVSVDAKERSFKKTVPKANWLLCYAWLFYFFIEDQLAKKWSAKGSSSYHLCVGYFSQSLFDYTYVISNCFKTAADYV